MKIEIKNSIYQIEVLERPEYERLWGTDSNAITVMSSNKDSRIIYFNLDCHDGILAHEIMHVYFDHSSFYDPKIGLDQKEEVCCGLLEDNWTELLALVKKISRYIKRKRNEKK